MARENLIECFKVTKPNDKLYCDPQQFREFNIDAKNPVLVKWDDREDWKREQAAKKDGKGGAGKGGDAKNEDENEKTPAGPTRAELEAEASKLNIPFSKNMKDETIAAKIADAKNK